MAYISTTDVSDELNGLTIDSSSTPSTDTVEAWIDQEQDLINRETGRLWGYNLIEAEYADYDGSGFLKTLYAPIISITSFETEKNGIDSTEDDWVTLTEGRRSTDSFIVYKTDGELQFHGTTQPTINYQNCRTTYAAGYETTNKTVKLILAKKVALRVISTVINGQSSEEGGQITVDVISISDPSTFSLQRVMNLKTEIKTLTSTLGTFKTYRTTRK